MTAKLYAGDLCPRCRSRKCECLPCPGCGAPVPGVRNPRTRIVEAVRCTGCELELERAEAEAYFAEARSKCPHGLEWSECNPCMIAGDLAFDAAREDRAFGSRR